MENSNISMLLWRATSRVRLIHISGKMKIEPPTIADLLTGSSDLMMLNPTALFLKKKKKKKRVGATGSPR